MIEHEVSVAVHPGKLDAAVGVANGVALSVGLWSAFGCVWLLFR